MYCAPMGDPAAIATTTAAATTTPSLHAFVTVGSTRFDALIIALFSPATLSTLRSLGVTHLTAQHGGSALPAGYASACVEAEISVSTFAYAADISPYMRSADLVVSHAGAGTLFEALHMRKRVVAVVNRALMHDHQTELAGALHTQRCLVSTDVAGLRAAMKECWNKESVPLQRRADYVVASVVSQEVALLRAGARCLW